MKALVQNKLWNKSITRRLSSITLLLVLITIGTPYTIQYGITKGLNALAGQQVKINDVDFNPFTGTLIIKGLQSSDDKTSKLNIPLLSIQLDWLPLFNKQILVKSFALQNSLISIEQNKDNEQFIAGFKLPVQEPVTETTESKPSSWSFGIEQITLLNNHIDFSTPAFATQISIDDIKLNSLLSWQPAQSANFSFAMHIDDAVVSGKLNILAFAERPHLKGNIKIDRLILDNLKHHTENRLTQLKGSLSTDLDFELSLGKNQLNYQQQGTIQLHDFLLATDTIQLSQQQLLWSGRVDFSQHQQVDKSNLSIQGNLNAHKINALSLSTKQTLLKLNKLTLKALSIKQLDNIQLANITLEGLTLAKPATKKPLVQAKIIAFNTLKLSKLRDIDLKKLNINGIAANVHINKQSTISALDEFISSLKSHADENHTEPPAPLAQKEQKFFIRVDEISVSGNNLIKLSSATVSNSIQKDIRLKSLTIGEVNNQTPAVPTPFKLYATINEHSKLLIDGDITPFSQKTNAQITAKLTSFELPEFSPIIRQELGYDIESGQLNAEIKGLVKKDILNGNVKIAIHKLMMQAADQSKTAKITKQLTMPLDSALSLLRDENDNIELEIPIKGDIAQPDFEISGVINTAIGNALQGTVTSYLKYALQPYGLIYMAAESAYGAATKLSLEPIKFQAGGLEHPKQANKYLQSIGQLMQKRPQLTLRLCGFATSSDRLKLIELNKKTILVTKKPADIEAQLDEQLLLLAGKRQQWVKSYLISSYEINESRLFTCLPKVSKGESQLPRVELLI